MNRLLKTIIVATLLASAQSSFGFIVTQRQGLVFTFHGHDYGVYDERYGDLLSVSDGKIVGGAYWSGIQLGPLGRFGLSTTHPWVRESAPFVLGAVVVLCVVIALRRSGRRVKSAT